ncbi:MAG TPA: dihydrofolate reductase [Steroidobacteraceae bacterium]|nr:dihydrofolate reductase [Steroidobacteraceae bacterium]
MIASVAAVEFVVAASENGVIGRNNGLPWRLPEDLRRFKALTVGGTVLMGRKTYESIGRALPDRRNLILSRRPDFAAAGCIAVRSLEEAGRAALPGRPLMVIGGAEIYRLCLPHANRIHLTLVHAHIADGDAYFDAWRGPEWRESFREPRQADERHAFAYTFVTLDRS